MQNVQNAAEIQQRVIKLVELYRTKVGKESQIAKDAKADQEYWGRHTMNMMAEDGIAKGDLFGEGPHTEVWIKHLKVNEQLLGHFYQIVAGNEAKAEVLSQLLPDIYDPTIFTEEEEMFLSSHFKELVDYLIQTPNNDLELVNRYESKDEYLVPKEILEVIASQTQIPPGSIVYNPMTGFAQLTTLFKDCHFICGGDNPWAHVAIFANGVNAEMLDGAVVPDSYDALLSFLPMPGVPLSENLDNKLCQMYDNLKEGGRIILIMPSLTLVKCGESEKRCFWHNLVNGQEIVKMIQLPSVMFSDRYCIVLAEKNRKHEKTTFIDSGFASFKGDAIYDMLRKEYWDTFDVASFNEMLKKDGRDPISGEKKMIDVDSASIDANMLLPEFYLMKRPASEDEPLPLSSLCDIVKTNCIGKLDFDLPQQTPWLRYDELSYTFHGYVDLGEIEKANCPNNPKYSDDMKLDFNESGEFIDDYFHFIVSGTPKGQRIYEYRNSSFMNGKDDVVFICIDDIGVKCAIVPKSPIPYAAECDNFMTSFYAFTPKNGISALKLLALLRMPIVYNQIKLYTSFGGLSCHLDEIMVPYDERIKREYILRLECEEKEYKDLKDKLVSMKTDYINEVRMRKHDMRPHMKQLKSASNLMRHYIDNLDTIDDAKQHLNHQLFRFSDALGHLSDIIDHLSDEEKFGEPERFSITDYFEKIVSESMDNGGNLAFEIDADKVGKYLINKLNDYTEHMKGFAKEKDKDFINREYPFPLHWTYVNIAPLDLDRMVQNIIENARIHGFTDPSRTDYMIWINLSVDEKRDMYQIDFMNNGTPLPEGMTKSRYGIKGEKAGLKAGTGSGGYIVKSIVTHYGGDYDVLCKDGITIIRVFLPIATV